MIRKICKKVTEQCKPMEPTVRTLFTICEIEGKIIVSAEIPGVDFSERPVFYKGVGRIKGSYVQVSENIVDSGKLKLTLPEKPKSSKQKYVKV